ncbi:hypothetical protein NIES4073_23020 [Kalymmatonema gypsitolerans NIES-4073]|nr:hypothetical protein NIES4073_23020 [Scytonema sp. NIES-4073]
MLDWWEKNFATLELGELPEAAALALRAAPLTLSPIK